MSTEKPQIDRDLAHRHFSSGCFNHTWTLIEKQDRTPADDEAMVLCALASLWHWTQRPDCTERNLSIGHWQISRVYALTGQGESAMTHARKCVEHAAGSPPFYIGYGHEAAARAALVLGDVASFREYLDKAHALAAQVEDVDERTPLEDDIRDLEERARP